MIILLAMDNRHEPNFFFFRGAGSRSQRQTLFVSDYIFLLDTDQITPLDVELGVKTVYNNESTLKYLRLLPEAIYIAKFRETLLTLRAEYTFDILYAAETRDLAATVQAVRDFDSLNPLFPGFNILRDRQPATNVNSLIGYYRSPQEEATIAIARALRDDSVEDIIRAVHQLEARLSQTKQQNLHPLRPNSLSLNRAHPIFQLCKTPRDSVSTAVATAAPAPATTTNGTMSSSRFPSLQTSNLPQVREDGTQQATASPRDAARLNMLRVIRPPPFKYAWTFYHDRHSEAKDGGDYDNRLTVLLENIISLKPFWEAYHHFPLGSLRMKDSVHFFKRGVRPVWEDPRNVRGGSWTFRVPKDRSEQFWKEVLLLAVGEQFADVLEPRDDLCGLSLSTRFNSNLITIWNRDGANQKAVDGIRDVVLNGVSAEIKPRENSYYYKKHSEHAGFEEAVAKARAELDQASKAKAEQLGKIEEAKVTEVDVAKQEKEELEQEAKQAAQAVTAGQA